MNVLKQAHALRSEAARLLTDIEKSGIGATQFLVTGCKSSEGVSSLTLALGLAAQRLTQSSALVVDATTRGRSLSDALSRNAQAGLRDLIEDTKLDPDVRTEKWRASIERVETDVDLFPRGMRRGAELVDIAGRRSLEPFIDFAGKQYRYVFWDTDTANDSLDTKVLAAHIPNVILVVESDTTRMDHFSSTVQELEALGAHLAAVVRNRAGRRMFSVGADQQ